MDLKNQIAAFIDKNNIVGVCAGVTVGLVTKEVVLSLVSDLVIPLLILILYRLKIPIITKFMPEKNVHPLNFVKFFGSAVTWILAIVITFLFVQYAFIKLIGVQEKKDVKVSGSGSGSKDTTSTNDANTSANINQVDAFIGFRN
jgi:large-conductance mechanosensitive channel